MATDDAESTPQLTHLDAQGNARMVDVGHKAATERLARASGRVRMAASTIDRVMRGDTPKGDVLAVTRIAAIQGAKRTSELIPLCHPLPITSVRVDITRERDDVIVIEATVTCVGRTGVEMEALTAVSVGALALYDMVKAIDRTITIESIALLEKRGGKSGDYVR